MPKSKGRSHSKRSSTPSLLDSLLFQLEWLEKSKDDDAVSVEEWRQKGNHLLQVAGTLKGSAAKKFHAAWDAFQARESGGSLFPQINAPLENSPEQLLADKEAYARISQILSNENLSSN